MNMTARAGATRPLQVLWITRELPIPENTGERIYSGRLINALAGAGAELVVLCPEGADGLAPPATPARWRAIRGGSRPSARTLSGPLPRVATRADTPRMRAALEDLLRERPDVVVLDHLGTGWALDVITAFPNQPLIVYISHNDEETARRRLAERAGDDPVRRRLLRRDAAKAARLERRLLAEADLVTAITESDAKAFADRRAEPALVLSPGFDGPGPSPERIAADLPRRACVLGSFDWVAKRLNLEELLAVADRALAAGGAELIVIGRGPRRWVRRQAGTWSATSFTGEVPNVAPHLANCRVGFVAEPRGGGFKLKALHYVFNGVPIVALRGSLTGLPLEEGVSIEVVDRVEDLAPVALALMDDPQRSARQAQAALAACAGRFDWAARGRILNATLRRMAGIEIG